MRLPLLLFLCFEVTFATPSPPGSPFTLNPDVIKQLLSNIKITQNPSPGEATPTGEACDDPQLQPQIPQHPKYQYQTNRPEVEIKKQNVPNVHPQQVYKRRTDEYAQQPEPVYQQPPQNFGNQHGQAVHQRQINQFSEQTNQQGEEYTSQQTLIPQQSSQGQDHQVQQLNQKQFILKQQHEQRMKQMQHMRQQNLMQQRQHQQEMQQRLLQEQQQERQEYGPEDVSQQKTYFSSPQMPPVAPMPPMPPLPQMPSMPPMQSFNPQQMPHPSFNPQHMSQQRSFPRGEGVESPYQTNVQPAPAQGFPVEEEGAPNPNPYQLHRGYPHTTRHPADTETQPAQRKTSRQIDASRIRVIRPSEQ